MSSVLTRAWARWLLRHPGQLVLAVLGVALGVAVTLSIDLAIESSRAAFRTSTETVAGRTTHQVTGGAGGLPDTVFAAVRRAVGPERAAPLVEGFVRAPALPGRPLRLLGIDPFSEGPFRGFTAPVDGGATRPLLGTTVALSQDAAAEAGVGVGDPLAVDTPTGRASLTVVRTFRPDGALAQEGTRDVLVVDIATAQALLGETGLTRIDLILPEAPADEALLRTRLDAVLPPDATVGTTGARAQTLAEMTRAFDLNLTALSLLALLFGMFLIYNTLTFSVVQRRDLMGMLRALGVTRAEVGRLLLVETVLLGAVGTGLGLLLGTLLGRGLVRLVTQTINDLYLVVTAQGLGVDPALLARAAVLGVGATVLAALPPLREAVSAPPRIATLRSELESRARSFVRRGAWVGGACLAVGAALLVPRWGDLLPSFGGLFFVVMGFALVAPWGATMLVTLVRPLLGAALGPLGRLAAGGVTGALSRTGPAIAALVVAVSVTVGLGVMIASFRDTVARWLDQTLQADVYISPPSVLASRAQGALPPAFVDGVRALPGLAALSTYRGLEFESAYGLTRLVALDLAPPGERAFRFLSADAPDVLRAFREDGAVIVSEPFAYRHGLAPGDSVRLPTPSGLRAFVLAGVFYEYGSELGTVMMARTTFDRFWPDRRVTSLGLFADAAVDAETLVERVRGLPGAEEALVRSNRTLRAASLEVFDRTFAVTAVLRLLALGVAFIGVLGALLALELERAREHAVLRAQGVTPGGLWGLVTLETGLVGLVAGVLAVPAGLVLARIMIDVINKRSFGWTLQTYVPWSVLVQAVVLSLVGALLAGIVPAWRMGRTSPAVALRNE
ncbi:MAG: ABC transporter permease [Gemmatimonadota bacterium]